MVYRCDTDDKLAAVHFLLYANAFGGSCREAASQRINFRYDTDNCERFRRACKWKDYLRFINAILIIREKRDDQSCNYIVLLNRRHSLCLAILTRDLFNKPRRQKSRKCKVTYVKCVRMPRNNVILMREKRARRSARHEKCGLMISQDSSYYKNFS